MRRLIIVVAAVLLGLWSLFAWAVHALLQAASGFAAENAYLVPVPPEWVYWAAQVFSGASGIGGVLVWIVWGLVAALIVVLALVALKLAGNGRDRRGAAPGPVDRGYSDTVEPPAVRAGRASVEDIVSRVSGKRRS
jgi:hypothetical protein